jgi:alkylation response protein AidB-like acyl-CoA dehydrogenase
MANYYLDNEDLQFYVKQGIDWDPIVEITEYGYRAADGHADAAEGKQFYEEVAEMLGQFVAEEIAPHVAEIDAEGVRLKDGEAHLPAKLQAIFEQIRELDLHAMCLPRELGGMNAPMLLYYVNSEVMARADVSTMAHFGFHGGIAMAMLMFSILEGSTEFDNEKYQITKTRFADYIEEIVAGRAWGCMDITEPGAGSDMGALRARGEVDEEGNWTVSGEKIFITSGHGKYHFVIARTEKVENPDDPMSGLRGLSMFLVPTYTEDADGNRQRIAPIERVEEKLGHHGSVTATVNFDRTPAHLIGQRGEGFKHMLTLMNNARIGVGFECLGLCEAAYRKARDYAADRPSMGKSIDQHEMIADYLDEMASDIQGIRALAMHAAYHEELSTKIGLVLKFMPPAYEARRSELERQLKISRAAGRRVTPLLKYLASEKAVEMGRRCIQIHGGNGYIVEYGAEKLLRDAVVMPIYEGTSQIQSLMAMKDTLGGIMKNPQGFVKRLAQCRVKAYSGRDSLARRVARIQQISTGVQQYLLTRTASDKVRSLSGKPVTEWSDSFLKNWDPKKDFACAMLHAERLTLLLADEAICEILLDQAVAHPERAEVLERYLERAEPRCVYLREVITTTGNRLLGKLKGGVADAEERGR